MRVILLFCCRKRSVCIFYFSWITAANKHRELLENLGVISPYKAQQLMIKSKLREKIKLADVVEVDTVDSFQGREKDIIIISCGIFVSNEMVHVVRSVTKRHGKGDTTSSTSIGFLSDERRLNVGLYSKMVTFK